VACSLIDKHKQTYKEQPNMKFQVCMSPMSDRLQGVPEACQLLLVLCSSSHMSCSLHPPAVHQPSSPAHCTGSNPAAGQLAIFQATLVAAGWVGQHRRRQGVSTSVAKSCQAARLHHLYAGPYRYLV
jgi:hypothetical protein